MTTGAVAVDAPASAGDGRARRRERNAALLYDAAIELLASHSYEEVSVDDICAHAGVGRATFFRIFDSKAGLLREFNRRLAADAARRLEASGATDLGAALEQVRAAVVDAWRHAGPGQVGMAREFVRSVPTGDPHAPHPELLGLVVDLVRRAAASGDVSDPVPVELAASLALMHLVAPISFAISGADVDIEALSRLLLAQWLAGRSAARG